MNTEPVRKRPSYTPGARTKAPPAPMFTTPLEHELPGAIPALIQRAQTCLDTWGEFASRPERIRSLIKQGDLGSGEYHYLKGLIDATERRAGDRAVKAKAAAYIPAGDSDLSDAEVTAAIRLLTGRDSDHAELANGEGWSAGDSATGHWCYAMLSTDPAAAIAVARGIVGKYKRQLAMAGIIG